MKRNNTPLQSCTSLDVKHIYKLSSTFCSDLCCHNLHWWMCSGLAFTINFTLQRPSPCPSLMHSQTCMPPNSDAVQWHRYELCLRGGRQICEQERRRWWWWWRWCYKRSCNFQMSQTSSLLFLEMSDRKKWSSPCGSGGIWVWSQSVGRLLRRLWIDIEEKKKRGVARTRRCLKTKEMKLKASNVKCSE